MHLPYDGWRMQEWKTSSLQHGSTAAPSLVPRVWIQDIGMRSVGTKYFLVAGVRESYVYRERELPAQLPPHFCKFLFVSPVYGNKLAQYRCHGFVASLVVSDSSKYPNKGLNSHFWRKETGTAISGVCSFNSGQRLTTSHLLNRPFLASQP